jgi:hypothetical protein
VTTPPASVPPVPALPSVRWLLAVAVALGRRPSLWATALGQVRALAAPGWWRRAPFLPLPDPGYLAFRLQTAYGDPVAEPRPADLVTYLHWCRAWPRVAG